MDPMQRLLAERECERLVYRYCHLIDHGEAAKVSDLFTDDGVWASPEVTRDGKDKIANWRALSSAGETAKLVEALLEDHYDPAYLRSIARNFPRVVDAEAVELPGIAPSDFLAAAQRLAA